MDHEADSALDWRTLPEIPASREILADDASYTLTRMSAPPCRGPAPHAHPHKQLVYMLRGSGAMLVGQRRRRSAERAAHHAPPDRGRAMAGVFYARSRGLALRRVRICWKS